MQAFIRSIIALILLLSWGTAGAGLTFYDPCEDDSRIPPNSQKINFWYRNSHANVAGNKLASTTEQARAGQRSYKFYLAPYTSAANWASDCELALRPFPRTKYPANFTPGKEYWMGFSVFVPASQRWPEADVHPEGGGGEWGLLWQFHGSGNPCDISGINPVQAAYLTADNNGYQAGVSGYVHVNSGDTRTCLTDRNYEKKVATRIPFTRGVWHDYVINFRFTPSWSKSGLYRLWQDGSLVVNETGINMYNLVSRIGPYFLFGVYGHMTTGFTVYFDEIRVGDSTSSYDEVKPQGARRRPETDSRR